VDKIQTVKISHSKLPKMLGSLIHSNQFLKMLSVSTLVLLFLSLSMNLVLVYQEPFVITLNSAGENLQRVNQARAEDQIREGIKAYLQNRYEWGPQDVHKKLKQTESFITPQALKAYQGAVFNVAKFSTEKLVTQRIFPERIEINLSQGTALITGDRITSIQGLRAAGNLKLELTFVGGPRTQTNPWGIYISKEREEQ
jgi:type IV secretory pathway component VirB8